LFGGRGSAANGFSANDIIGTIGTLIGFLFTAYGLLANAHLDPSTFNTISGLVFVMMAFLILTAFLAALGAAADKPQASALAMGIYPASWVALGLGVGIIFLSIMFPQFPFGDYASALVVAVVGTLIAVVASINSVGIYRSLESVRVESLAPGTADVQAMVPPRGAADVGTTFLNAAAQLESRVKELYQSVNPQPVTDPPDELAKILYGKGKLSADDYSTFRALWRVRNLLVHGQQVAQGDLAASVAVASQLQSRLESPTSAKGPQGGA